MSSQDSKVKEHLDILRKSLLEIKVQVLKTGDSLAITTGDGEETVEVAGNGKLPVKKYASDAGFDLFSPEKVYIRPGEVVKVPLNIRFNLPDGTWGEIRTKSGLGSKGMLVYAGVIDQGYTGVPHVVATNVNHRDGEPIIIGAGEKIAQLVMHPYRKDYYMTEVGEVSESNERGDAGFGSQGRK